MKLYKKIMVPVDLSHVGDLDKALKTAGTLAKQFSAPVIYTSVTAAAPSPVAHSPQEFEQKLSAFAAKEGASHGIDAEAKAIVSHDPTVDLDETLMKAVKDTGADLVVMQSHLPNLTDYIWPSNGGTIATHSSASVFVVR